MQEFGRYIVNRAISQLAHWQKVNVKVPIAVNLSPYNLLDPGLVDFIRHTLEVYDVTPDLLEIELTENATSLNIEYIKKVLDDIRDLGVSLAIDDFGTGMSSLAYLSALNVNVLKIDRTFISDMDSNIGHRAIIASAITLSGTFGCKMVAEGVETRQQAGMLLEMGCNIAQGFLFARPMPVTEIEALLKEQRSLYSYECPLAEAH